MYAKFLDAAWMIASTHRAPLHTRVAGRARRHPYQRVSSTWVRVRSVTKIKSHQVVLCSNEFRQLVVAPRPPPPPAPGPCHRRQYQDVPCWPGVANEDGQVRQAWGNGSERGITGNTGGREGNTERLKARDNADSAGNAPRVQVGSTDAFVAALGQRQSHRRAPQRPPRMCAWHA